ncbi:MAG: hypothetical protein LBM99_05455 [Bacillales bacterium]|jgi:hypothetical protein|nr:hypothetical protein [Bacillales bacterium]
MEHKHPRLNIKVSVEDPRARVEIKDSQIDVVLSSGKVSVLDFSTATVKYDGVVNVGEKSWIEIYGNVKLNAEGEATVWAYDNTTVQAVDDVTIKSYNTARVLASGHACVVAFDDSTVKAIGKAKIISKNTSKIEARGKATVWAFENSDVSAYENSKVYSYDESLVAPYEDAYYEKVKTVDSKKKKK